jgi:peptide-methionine (S)-S-oxide reductase
MTNRPNLKSVILSALVALGVVLSQSPARAAETETLIVAGGCFWCVESDFEGLPGVVEAVSGYTGGALKNPTYKQVSGGGTGHYEAVKIIFNPSKISRDTILDKFFRSIDPLDAGGQFCDRGDSYRSAIFVDGNAQKSAAETAKSNAASALNAAIVTPIFPATRFYDAESYHQDYYKGDSIVLTRFGPKRQSSAYKAYRKACGRDKRVKQLWGNNAAFVHG